MPDLLAGEIILAGDTPPTGSDREDGTLTTTSTTYIAGSTVCGCTFVASTTGRAVVYHAAYLYNNNVAATTHCSVRVGTGSVIGAGTQIQAAADETAVTNLGSTANRFGVLTVLTGLTPGSTYNLQTMHRVTAGTGEVRYRTVVVNPAT